MFMGLPFWRSRGPTPFSQSVELGASLQEPIGVRGGGGCRMFVREEWSLLSRCQLLRSGYNRLEPDMIRFRTVRDLLRTSNRRALLRALGILLASAPAALGQAYPFLDIPGWAADAEVGGAVAASDVNGDGLPDVVVGAPGVGEAKVFSGVDGSVLLSLTGSATGVAFGRVVDGVGDVNGDGHDDVLVGESFYVTLGSPGEVRATIFSGQSGAPLRTLSLFPQACIPSPFPWVPEADARSAGDVDGDGVQDVILGPTLVACFGLQQVLEARIFSGATGATLHLFSRTFPPDPPLGSIVPVGDVDGNGQGDFIFDEGSFVVYSGSTFTPLQSFSFGAWTTAAGIGDVDGDGYGDFALGSIGDSSSPGIVTLFRGNSWSPLWTVYEAAPDEDFGDSVAAPGDVDEDGVPDVLVGAPGWAVDDGRAVVFSGVDGSVFATLLGNNGDEFGAVVAGLGDVDGDGHADFAVGAPSAEPSNLGAEGQVLVSSNVPVPGAMTHFGEGCPGSNGKVPFIFPIGGPPSVSTGNANFGFLLKDAAVGAPTWLLIGFSNSTWAGVSLPWLLAPLGLAACHLLVSPDAVILVLAPIPPFNLMFAPIPIPPAPALVGQVVFAQWFVADPPGAMTDGFAIVLQ
jgi:hypothetical protein